MRAQKQTRGLGTQGTLQGSRSSGQTNQERTGQKASTPEEKMQACVQMTPTEKTPKTPQKKRQNTSIQQSHRAQNQLRFYTLTMNYQKEKLREQTHLQWDKKE